MLQVLALVTIISLLVIMDALLQRQHNLTSPPRTGRGIVAGKHAPETGAKGMVYRLDLQLTLEDGSQATLVAECPRETWEKLVEGDRVVVKYDAADPPRVVHIGEIVRTAPPEAPPPGDSG